MPGKKIREVDQRKIDPKFICCACTLLLDQPTQTRCGHLMCSSCLELLFSKEKPTCPVDGTELKKEEVFPDGYTKRELKALKLYCPNVECKWQGSYDELEAHSGVCDYALIKCNHYQCKEQIQRSHLFEHLNNECEYREVNCEHCGTKVAFASIKEHVSTICPSAPVICRHCKTNILRKDVKEHEEHLCNEVPGVCEFKDVGCKHQKVMKRKELRQHLNDRLIYHVRLLLQFVLNFVAQLNDYIPRVEFSGMMQVVRDDVSEIRRALTEKFVTLVEKMTGLEKRMEARESTETRMKTEFQELKTKLTENNTTIASLREENMALNRQLREKTTEIDRLRSRLDQNDEALALNTVKVAELESVRGQNEAIHSYNGTLLWKISGFQRKRQDAISGVTTALYSSPFYSSQFGYKMCAKIYMNGDGFGRGSHLSLFFVVMKGEYDALQTWPFQKKITMMLMDQGNGDHMIDAFHSDPQSSSFQRPRSNMNIASGSPLFMPLDSLNNREYIKDDVMFIKIIVD